MPIRVNTNGLANLQYGENIVPRLAKVVDTISISLNAPDAEAYSKVSRPRFDHAFEGLLDFTVKCKELIPHVKLTVVDILAPEDIKASQELAKSLGVDYGSGNILRKRYCMLGEPLWKFQKSWLPKL